MKLRSISHLRKLLWLFFLKSITVVLDCIKVIPFPLLRLLLLWFWFSPSVAKGFLLRVKLRSLVALTMLSLTDS